MLKSKHKYVADYKLPDRPKFRRKLDMIDLASGKTLLVCSHHPRNGGGSITNWCEKIATQVCSDFSIRPSKPVWLERCPHGPKAESPHPSHLVTFKNSRGKLSSPKWREPTPNEWYNLIVRAK